MLQRVGSKWVAAAGAMQITLSTSGLPAAFSPNALHDGWVRFQNYVNAQFVQERALRTVDKTKAHTYGYFA